MRLRRKRSTSNELSLVPLADMLTNTVGIMVFILIFTILSAGNAVLLKRLPMEHDVYVEKQVDFLCCGGQVYVLEDDMVEKLIAPVKEALERNRSRDISDVMDSMGGTVERENSMIKLTLTLQHSVFGKEPVMTCVPKPNKGWNAGRLDEKDSEFIAILNKFQKKNTLVRFHVCSNSIDAFSQARDCAVQTGFAYNWFPEENTDKFEFHFGGGGGGGIGHGQ